MLVKVKENYTLHQVLDKNIEYAEKYPDLKGFTLQYIYWLGRRL